MTPRNLPSETPHEQLHQIGPGSTQVDFVLTVRVEGHVGSRAQLKIKKLKEEQRLKTMEHDLEKQRLQLEMERQLLNARVEV